MKLHHKHAQYSDAANPPGEAEASKAIRTLRSILSHFATDYVEDGSELLLPKGNPVEHMKAKRVRKPMQSRTSYLKFESRIKLLDWIIDCSHQMEYAPLIAVEDHEVKAATECILRGHHPLEPSIRL